MCLLEPGKLMEWASFVYAIDLKVTPFFTNSLEKTALC